MPFWTPGNIPSISFSSRYFHLLALQMLNLAETPVYTSVYAHLSKERATDGQAQETGNNFIDHSGILVSRLDTPLAEREYLKLTAGKQKGQSQNFHALVNQKKGANYRSFVLLRWHINDHLTGILWKGVLGHYCLPNLHCVI